MDAVVQNILIVACVVLNVVGFILMGVDKSRARRSAWRIPEKTFFIIAVCGGSLGVLAGIYTFRHKTKHRSFTLGIPAIIVLQLALLWWLS